MKKKIKNIYDYMQSSGEVSREALKEELNEKIKGKKKIAVKKIRLVDFIRNEILSSSELKENSKKTYITFANKLETFESTIKKPLYSNDINTEIFNAFIDQVRNEVNKINTVFNAFKTFRAVLNKFSATYKVEVFNPTKELSKKEKVRGVTEEKAYLSFEQLNSFIEYQPKTDKMKNIKLIFLTLAFTGCRYSDVFKIRPAYNYSKNGLSFSYARIITQKGKKDVIIPILKPLIEAIEANNGQVANTVSERFFNAEIKLLFKECGFTEDETQSYTSSKNEKVIVTRKFWECITSHTGRRSFITNLINFLPLPMLCKITTHEIKERSIIFTYNKITLLENTVQFIHELKRLRKSRKEHFIFDLI
jgi:integrase